MIHDIYNRLPTDAAYKINIETTDEIEQLLQQIKMVLGTNPGEVLGSPGLGVNIRQFVFNYSIDKSTLKEMIMAEILNYVYYNPDKFNISVDINFGKSHDSSGDYAVIDISINEVKYLGIMLNQL